MTALATTPLKSGLSDEQYAVEFARAERGYERGNAAFAEVARSLAIISAAGRPLPNSIPALTARMLIRVGEGKLDLDAFFMFGANPGFVRRLIQLPLIDQRRLAQTDGRFEIWEVGEAGEFQSRKHPVPELSAEHVRQLFGDGELRGKDAQIRYLRDRQAAERLKSPKQAATDVVIRKGGREVVFPTGKVMPLSELSSLVARLTAMVAKG